MLLSFKSIICCTLGRGSGSESESIRQKSYVGSVHSGSASSLQQAGKDVREREVFDRPPRVYTGDKEEVNDHDMDNESLYLSMSPPPHRSLGESESPGAEQYRHRSAHKADRGRISEDEEGVGIQANGHGSGSRRPRDTHGRRRNSDTVFGDSDSSLLVAVLKEFISARRSRHGEGIEGFRSGARDKDHRVRASASWGGSYP